MSTNRQPAALPHTGVATLCIASYFFEPGEVDAVDASLDVRKSVVGSDAATFTMANLVGHGTFELHSPTR